MGVPVTSGGFRERIASAQYYGLVVKDGDRYRATARADLALGDDPDARRIARQGAVMRSGFGPIVQRFASREANEQTVSLRLQEDLSVPEVSAGRIAVTLLRTAEQAQLVAESRFDAAAIEAAAEFVTSGEAENGEGHRGDELDSPSPERKLHVPAEAQRHGLVPQDVTQVETPSLDEARSPVDVSIHIEVAHLTVGEIVELVRRLGDLGAPSA
jgi:hypothetical protein